MRLQRKRVTLASLISLLAAPIGAAQFSDSTEYGGAGAPADPSQGFSYAREYGGSSYAAENRVAPELAGGPHPKLLRQPVAPPPSDLDSVDFPALTASPQPVAARETVPARTPARQAAAPAPAQPTQIAQRTATQPTVTRQVVSRTVETRSAPASTSTAYADARTQTVYVRQAPTQTSTVQRRVVQSAPARRVTVQQVQRPHPIPSEMRRAPVRSASSHPVPVQQLSARPAGLPPSARPGECYARVLRPAEYRNAVQTIRVQDGFTQYDTQPPFFETTTQRVKVRDEGVRYEVRQPRYETRHEQVMVRPAHEVLRIIPGEFKTVAEQVVVQPARQVWKPGHNLSDIRKVDPHTGAVYCLVEEPAVVETVHRRVLVRPEQVQRVHVPAQYMTIAREVMVDRGGVREVRVPAAYRDVPVETLARGAVAHPRQMPAQTRQVETRQLVKPERFEWVPVLCETNATPHAIRAVQQALVARGYDTGGVDGIAGPKTTDALRHFQARTGLAPTGLITADTLRALGLSHFMEH